jgi:hypothetical protein
MIKEFKDVKIEEVAYLINFVEHLNNQSRDSYRAAVSVKGTMKEIYKDQIFNELIKGELAFINKILETIDQNSKMKEELIFRQIRDSYFDNRELFEIMLEPSEVFKLKPYLKL